MILQQAAKARRRRKACRLRIVRRSSLVQPRCEMNSKPGFAIQKVINKWERVRVSGPLVLLVVLNCISCDSRSGGRIVLGSGAGKLVYNCGGFRAQAETGEDMQILAVAFAETVGHAVTNGNIITIQSLQSSWEKKDWRSVERQLVEYRCQHRRDFEQ
jgi:hypothetical protein